MRLALLALSILVLAACTGGGPTDSRETCLTPSASGSTIVTAAVQSDRVIRDGAAHAAVAAEFPPGLAPPVPESGQMLLVSTRPFDGCGGCVFMACVVHGGGSGGRDLVQVESSGYGDCDAEGFVGGWAIVP